MKTDANLTRKRVNLSNGTVINIRLAVDDLTAFNRYIIKEHGSPLQGEDVFGKNPAADCVANCLYDELSGWLDNPSILGLTVLDILFDENKIEEEENTQSTVVNTSDLVKFLGEVASKDHRVEAATNGAEVQLTSLRAKARELLGRLVPTKGD